MRFIQLFAFLSLLPVMQASTITNVNFSGLLTGTMNQNQPFESYFYLTLSAPTSDFPATSLQPFEAIVPVTATITFTYNGDSATMAGQSLMIDNNLESITAMSWYSGSSKILGLINTIPSILEYSFDQPFHTTTGFGFAGSNTPVQMPSGLLSISTTQYVGMNVTITPDVTAPEPASISILLLGIAAVWFLRKKSIQSA